MRILLILFLVCLVVPAHLFNVERSETAVPTINAQYSPQTAPRQLVPVSGIMGKVGVLLLLFSHHVVLPVVDFVLTIFFIPLNIFSSLVVLPFQLITNLSHNPKIIFSLPGNLINAITQLPSFIVSLVSLAVNTVLGPVLDFLRFVWYSFKFLQRNAVKAFGRYYITM